jgi:hypothetical protein
MSSAGRGVLLLGLIGAGCVPPDGAWQPPHGPLPGPGPGVRVVIPPSQPEPPPASPASRASPAAPAIRAPRPRPWHLPVAPRKPANRAARQVLAVVRRIQARLTRTRYQPITRVYHKRGVYLWDCSGMADWILRRAAPDARRGLRKWRPLARDFYYAIARSPTRGQRRGWRRLRSPADVRPGDLFAWLKAPLFRKRKNTGHVGFILTTPQPHPRQPNVWLMRIADASHFQHEKDSRPVGGAGGFGTGIIAFLVDSTGQPTAYGWYGSLQSVSTFVPTRIVFGRVTR